MKPASLLLALPLLGCGTVDVITRVSSGGSGTSVVGTGKATAETRAAQAATDVVASGAVEVTVRQGPPKLVVSAQKEILQALKTEFKDGKLTIRVEGSSTSSEPIRVSYTAPAVADLEGGGATRFDVEGMSGDSSRIALSGASQAIVEGKVGKLDVEAAGASKADLRKLEAGDAKAIASGASTIRLGKTSRLEAQADGASTIRYAAPTGGVVKSDATGASSIEPG